MATCRAIINGALRKLGRLGAGREPRTADSADSLTALQGLYLSWIGSGAFGRLADVVPLTDFTAGENQRVIRDSTVVAVTLPEFVPAYSDPCPYGQEIVVSGVDNNLRPPVDGAVVQIADRDTGNVTSWIYDGTFRQWTSIEALQLDSPAPRSGVDPEGLSAALSLELADTFGAEIGAATARQASRFISGLVTHFSAPRRVVSGVYV